MSEPPAVLQYAGREVELPVVRGSENELGMDISKLRGETGLVTLDYGFTNTGSCESSITFIDGDQGILRYRGYPIDRLYEYAAIVGAFAIKRTIDSCTCSGSWGLVLSG